MKPIILDFAARRVWKPGEKGYVKKLAVALERAGKTTYQET